jgi:cytochrome c oxidase cbb3-type subunit III
MADNDRLIEHQYDGIQEFDNPLPRWWVILFWVTIIFSVMYVFDVGVGTGPGRIAQYEAEVAAAKAAAPVMPETTSPEELAALAASPQAIDAGKAVFAVNCVSCHKADGGGLIGPNLTDNAWIHGSTLSDIHKTVAEGVIAKGMPPWGTLLKPDQIDAVTVYVASLKGTNPPGAKAPEGTVVP